MHRIEKKPVNKGKASSPRRATLNPLHGLEVEMSSMGGDETSADITEDDMRMISVDEHALMVQRDRYKIGFILAVCIAAAVAIALNFTSSSASMIVKPKTDIESKLTYSY